MAKGDITCDSCNGSRTRKGVTGKAPCLKCNGMGALKANMKPYSEWEVLTKLLGENQALRNQVFLLQNAPAESQDQHTGRNNNNFRGD